MAAYLVFLPLGTNIARINDVNAVIAYGADAAAAKALAKAAHPANPTLWDNALAMAIGSNLPLLGWTFTVEIEGQEAVSVTGGWTSNTIDAIAAALVTALDALDDVAAAAYNSSTNVLTAAGVADELGDMALTVTVTDPNGVSQPSFFSTIVDEGDPEDALTVTFTADATAGIFQMMNVEGGIQLAAPEEVS